MQGETIVVATIWLAYLFLGFTVSSFALAYIFASNADSDLAGCVSGCYVMAMYLFVLIVFTLLARKKIMYFPMRRTSGSEFGANLYRGRVEDPATGRNEDSTIRQINDNRHHDNRSATTQGPTELVNRTIPTLLVCKVSDTVE